MTARRPPSLRDPQNYGLRLANGLRSMARGSDGGRILNASPVRDVTSVEAGVDDDATSTASTTWTPELIVAGYARVATNIAPPGLRVPFDCVLDSIYLRVGTAPTGAALIIVVKVAGVTASTLTVAASGTSTSSSGLFFDMLEGDIVTFDVTQIGSTVAGADVAVQLIAS